MPNLRRHEKGVAVELALTAWLAATPTTFFFRLEGQQKKHVQESEIPHGRKYVKHFRAPTL